MSKKQPRKYKKKRPPKPTKKYIRDGKAMVKAIANGRPGEYLGKHTDELARRFMLLGCTEQDLAHNLGITHETFIQWKRQYHKFSEAILDGGERADAQMADRLYVRALGYKYTETSIKRDYKGNESETVHTRQALPDVRALEIWLRNRQRKRWTIQPEGDEPPPPPAPIITVNNNSLDLNKLDDETIRKLIAASTTNKGTPS